MNDIIKKIEAEQLKENAPEFNVGDTVKVYAKIKEGNRERIQVFEGTVLKRQGGGARETFTVRKTSNGIGVEKTWPIHSPHVEKVEVIRRGKVRRAKLNYLRKRVGKAAKVKELVKEYCLPSGAYSNEKHFEKWVKFSDKIDDATRLTFFDPQTSGGLLISVSENKAEELLNNINSRSEIKAEIIGRVVEANEDNKLINII